jgi:hypothetical protein
MPLPMHIVLGLWNACKGIKEEENREQQKAEGGQNATAPSMSSMMSQAKSMMPSGAGKMPSMPSSFKR